MCRKQFVTPEAVQPLGQESQFLREIYFSVRVDREIRFSISDLTRGRGRKFIFLAEKILSWDVVILEQFTSEK